MRQLIARTSRETVASRVLCVEHFGYHSRRYAHAKLKLPSQEFGFDLVRQAMDRRALIILMRSRKLWEATIPELATYPRLLQLSNPQNPAVSPATCGERFEEVIAALAE